MNNRKFNNTHEGLFAVFHPRPQTPRWLRHPSALSEYDVTANGRNHNNTYYVCFSVAHPSPQDVRRQRLWPSLRFVCHLRHCGPSVSSVENHALPM